MEVVQVGQLKNGLPVYVDRFADGLGKQRGAESYHKLGIAHMARRGCAVGAYSQHLGDGGNPGVRVFAVGIGGSVRCRGPGKASILEF